MKIYYDEYTEKLVLAKKEKYMGWSYIVEIGGGKSYFTRSMPKPLFGYHFIGNF